MVGAEARPISSNRGAFGPPNRLIASISRTKPLPIIQLPADLVRSVLLGPNSWPLVLSDDSIHYIWRPTAGAPQAADPVGCRRDNMGQRQKARMGQAAVGGAPAPARGGPLAVYAVYTQGAHAIIKSGGFRLKIGAVVSGAFPQSGGARTLGRTERPKSIVDLGRYEARQSGRGLASHRPSTKSRRDL